MRTALALFALAFSAPLPASAEVPLDDLSAYITAIASAETAFLQTNSDGSTAEGRLILKRPYRMRFEYAPPDRTLVLASASTVAVFDPKSNEPPARYPLRKTPLNLILGRRIDLTAANMVTAHGEEGEFTTVTAQDPEHPEYGSIRLFFSAEPIALRAWTVTDDTGTETHVELGDLTVGGDYPDSLFDIGAETERRDGE